MRLDAKKKHIPLLNGTKCKEIGFKAAIFIDEIIITSISSHIICDENNIKKASVRPRIPKHKTKKHFTKPLNKTRETAFKNPSEDKPKAHQTPPQRPF